MKSLHCLVVTVALVASVAAPASADDQTKRPLGTALELGVRAGYSLPYGQVDGETGNGSTAMSTYFNGRLPLGIDAGLRLSNRSLYLGAYLQYAPVFATSNMTNNIANSSFNTVDVGFQANYHFAAAEPTDPWIGLGAGWEILNIAGDEGGAHYSENVNGFSVKAEFGIDFMLLDGSLGIGPFVSATLSEYDNCSVSGGESCDLSSKAFHGWFTLGFRGYYDIGL